MHFDNMTSKTMPRSKIIWKKRFLSNHTLSQTFLPTIIGNIGDYVLFPNPDAQSIAQSEKIELILMRNMFFTRLDSLGDNIQLYFFIPECYPFEGEPLFGKYSSSFSQI